MVSRSKFWLYKVKVSILYSFINKCADILQWIPTTQSPSVRLFFPRTAIEDDRCSSGSSRMCLFGSSQLLIDHQPPPTGFLGKHCLVFTRIYLQLSDVSASALPEQRSCISLLASCDTPWYTVFISVWPKCGRFIFRHDSLKPDIKIFLQMENKIISENI